MAIAKFSGEQFAKSLEPGIVAWVGQELQSRIEERVNAILEDALKEVMAEIPQEIKVRVEQAFFAMDNEQRVHVEVEIK